MAIYYAAVEGDPLDSGEGGHVYGTKKTIGTIKDENGKSRSMVFIGDEGYCAKCGSAGVITYGAGMADNRRMVDLVNGGRRQAVGGDIVLCKCATPPRIVALYGQKFKIIDGGGAMRSGIAENASGAVSPAPQEPEKPRHFAGSMCGTQRPVSHFAIATMWPTLRAPDSPAKRTVTVTRRLKPTVSSRLRFTPCFHHPGGP